MFRSKINKEVGNMKKVLMVMFFAVLSLALVYGNADAKVGGQCSNCHTMHNSQGGLNESKDFSGELTGTPNPQLTKSTCLGCHNGQVTGAPDIFEPVSTMTAGGTFDQTVVNAPAKAHNVRDITWTSDEVTLLNTTPGVETGGFAEPAGAAQLNCAGVTGCHGNHDASAPGSAAGISGFHHGSSAYRFLTFYDGSTSTDIKGLGSSTYEKGGADAGNHNTYYALSSPNSTDRDSISSLCSLCHGEFHDRGDTSTLVGGGNPWKRHPTEYEIPTDWNSINGGVTIDYNTTPFAFAADEFAGKTSATAYAADLSDKPRVACISCHRAHGSPYNDLLRFDYSTQQANGSATTGCLGCHTKQRVATP